MTYVLHVLCLFSIYALLAVSLDLIAGHTGMISLSHAGLFGTGAYVSALTTTDLGWPFPFGFVAALAAAGLLSLAVAYLSLRTSEDYFVLATLCLQVILFDLFRNAQSLTGGASGISGIPEPALGNLILDSEAGVLALTASCTALGILIISRIVHSPFGRVLHAIREDEVFTQAQGKNTLAFKARAAMVSAALAGAAGSLYAHYFTYIDPQTFSLSESILILSMVIIGGAGSRWGPVVGAALLVMIPEASRFIGLPGGIAGNVREILYGTFLVLTMLAKPSGLLGRATNWP